jgi:NAD(P)-dependent dehydrogenase (short-subunit alcohol dehydrogenase family)
MIEQSIRGTVALVTGGASGIGKATALLLGRADAVVAIVDRDAVGAEATASEVRSLGGHAEAFPFDLHDIAAIPTLVSDVLSKYHHIDILVNAAAILDRSQPIVDIDDETWDRVYTINLKAPRQLMQEVARHMIARAKGGKIVNVSSSSAFRAHIASPAYSSAKGALNQLTRSAAGELGMHDINVNAVVPGVTLTGMIGDSTPADMDKAVTAGPLANLMGRVSQPEDVANVILFLCLPDSRQITGQLIHVSAGLVV